MSTRLQDKVAIVTGGGRGIGAAIARRLAAEGAAVVIAQRDQNSADETARAMVEAGGRALSVETDVADPVSVGGMVEQTLTAFGRVDILVNNAGIAGTLGPVLDLTFETWNRVIGVNLSGVFLCSQAVARVMVTRKTPGRIVNVGSINGSIAQRNAAAYVASKGGVDMLTKALAVDLAQYGILVNCIAPGSIRVERNAGYFDAEPLATTFKKAIPLGHPGTGDDIAGAAAFLASDDSAFMTGAVLVVDGGFSSYFRID